MSIGQAEDLDDTITGGGNCSSLDWLGPNAEEHAMFDANLSYQPTGKDFPQSQPTVPTARYDVFAIRKNIYTAYSTFSHPRT